MYHNILQYTPILLQLEDFYSLVTSTSNEDPYIPSIKERTQNIILSPRFYFLIYPPAINHNTIKGKKALKYNIDRTGLLKDIVRLNLKPSTGYGINACYKIELWQWYPVVSQSEATKPKRITQELIHDYYIYVPKVSNHNYLVNLNYLDNWGYNFDYPLYFRKPLSTHKEVIVKRRYKDLGSSVILDEIVNTENVVDVFNITDKVKLVEQYKEIDIEKPFDKAVNGLALEWTTDYPNPLLLPTINTLSYYTGEIKYNINYIRPLQSRDILFNDFIEERSSVYR